MKRLIISLVIVMLMTAFSCTGGPEPEDTETNVIEQAIRELQENNVDETSQGMLILKRYEYYLDQLEKGNAYIDWRPNNNPPVYNATVFLRLMDREMIGKIVDNTTAGRDAFGGVTGFFERAYISEVDGILDSYLIYVPNKFSLKEEYPLVVMLHGYGDSAHLNPLSPVHFDFLKACERRRVIMAAPCGRQKLPSQRGFYINDAETDVLQVLSLVKKDYPIDGKRVYLTGNSMGGFGSFWIASRHPELFAGIAPVCGIWSGVMGYPRVDLDALQNIPVFLYHNEQDTVVPVSESRTAFEYLKKIGADVQYREIKVDRKDPWDFGVFGGHNAWDYAYQGTTLIDWFLQYSRE